jgi:hypothetical protein
MPIFGLFSEVKKWAGDLGVVWDEVSIVPCEAKELANLGWVPWWFPLSYTVKFAWVHTHLVLSNNYSEVFNFFFRKFTLGRLEIEVVVM